MTQLDNEKNFEALIGDSYFLADTGQINLDSFESFLLMISAIYNTPKLLKLLKFKIDSRRILHKQEHLQNLQNALVQKNLAKLSLDNKRAVEMMSNVLDLYNKKSIRLLDSINDFLNKKAENNNEIKQRIRAGNIFDDKKNSIFNEDIDESYILFCKQAFVYYEKIINECERKIKQIETNFDLS